MTPSDNLRENNKKVVQKYDLSSNSESSEFQKKFEENADKADKTLDDLQKIRQPGKRKTGNQPKK